MPDLREQAYEVLRTNLVAVRPELSVRDVILCPICLREFTRDDAMRWGVEHIIPQAVARRDAEPTVPETTRNQRCGITFLCRSPRTCASTGEVANEGCNGLKGNFYDQHMFPFLDDGRHESEELDHRHGVAILVMGYLAAFQYFGYEYILRDELAPIREQFDYPNDRRTDWLDDALYSEDPLAIHTSITETGMPFMFGNVIRPNAPLTMFFRRCQVTLPSGHLSIRHDVPFLGALLQRGA
jgi:hypothetical protein